MPQRLSKEHREALWAGNKRYWTEEARKRLSERMSKEQFGEKNPAWRGDDVTYLGRHKRVYRARGPASSHKCIDCGLQAYDWAQRHDTSGLDINDYDPRCSRCHVRYDQRGLPCKPGCTCRKHDDNHCLPDCRCGKHKSRRCAPDCTCKKHKR